MSIALKILQFILVTFLGIFPLFFPIKFNKNKRFFYRLNRNGNILVIIMVLAVGLSIKIEFDNNFESDQTKLALSQTKKTLNNLNQALEKNYLRYDPLSKTIINSLNTTNINKGSKLVDFTVGGNGQINGLTLSNNKFEQPVYFDYYILENTINQVVKRNNIKGRWAYMYACINTNGGAYLSEVEKVLNRVGFTVVATGIANPEPNGDSNGIKVYPSPNGNITIVVGNSTPKIR